MEKQVFTMSGRKSPPRFGVRWVRGEGTHRFGSSSAMALQSGVSPIPRQPPHPKSASAFTLIEIMIVVSIIAIVMTMSVPIVYKFRNREPLNKAVRDVVEVSSNARAQAIMQGKVTELVFRPRERIVSVSGAGAPRPRPRDEEDPFAAEAAPPPAPPGSGLSAQISDKVSIEMLDVNLTEYKDEEIARVRFYPNGTCDEMTLILHSDKAGWLKIATEITTGLTTVGPVQR